MKKKVLKLGRFQEVALIIVGSLMVALVVTRVKTPYFLEANILAVGRVEAHPTAEALKEEENIRKKRAEESLLAAQKLLRDIHRDYSDRQEELNFNFSEAGVDRSLIQGLFLEWEARLLAMEKAFNPNQMPLFWALGNDMPAFTAKVDGAFKTLYDQQRYINIGKKLAERKIEAIIAEIENRYQQLSLTAPDANDRMDDLEYDLANTTLKSVEENSELKDAQRVFAEKQSSLNDKKRKIRGLQMEKKESAKQEELLRQISDGVKKMEELLNAKLFNAGAFWDLSRAGDDLERNFWSEF